MGAESGRTEPPPDHLSLEEEYMGRIAIKKANRGKLRRATGTKKGKKIPVATLRRLKRSKNAKTRQRATFALNARRWKH